MFKSLLAPPGALVVTLAWAQPAAYPVKPIRVIVPFPAGGGIDAVARQLSPKLTEALGQPLIIENRVGASGTLGTDAVAKAAPDGYTLLATFASHAQNATLYRNLPYDTLKSFVSIIADFHGAQLSGDAPVVAGKNGQGFDRAREIQAG